MRFTEEALTNFAQGPAALEGIMHHMKPQGKEWSDFYQQNSFKERYFKLVANLLFYYRVKEMSEHELLGVLVLENCMVSYETPYKGLPFAFSLTFKVNGRFKDSEGKHLFSCRCDADVNKWVSALKVHSYEYWRSQYLILETKIKMKKMETSPKKIIYTIAGVDNRNCKNLTQNNFTISSHEDNNNVLVSNLSTKPLPNHNTELNLIEL